MPQYTAKELAKKLSCELVGDSAHVISGVSDLEHATQVHASFLGNPRYAAKALTSKAGLIVVPDRSSCQEGRNYLIHPEPTRIFQQLIEIYHGVLRKSGFEGIHPTAVIHPETDIAENVSIGPYVVIDIGVRIGAGTVIHPFVYVGADAVLGEGCLLHAHAVIRERVVLGKNVIIQPGAVIGSCGYGYVTDPQGQHEKLEHVGNVEIDQDVEIGANTTIDRARFQSTKIGKGTKIDNLVQIAHNVEIGRHCLIISQTGIAGSTKIGNHVVLAGKAAINGHIEICDQVMVAACSGVSKSITKPGKYGGLPAVNLAEYNKTSVFLRNIETYVQELKSLRERVDALQEKE